MTLPNRRMVSLAVATIILPMIVTQSDQNFWPSGSVALAADDEDLEPRVAKLEAAVQEISARLGRATQPPTYFNTIERRVKELEQTVQRLTRDLEQLERRVSRLETRR